MTEILTWALIVGVHVLGGGVWIGAMAFSVFVLHPRAERFFEGSRTFEDLLFTVVHGARWKVVAGIVGIIASGVLLTVARAGATDAGRAIASRAPCVSRMNYGPTSASRFTVSSPASAWKNW